MSSLDDFISKRSIRTLTAILIACVTIPAVAVVFASSLYFYRDKLDEVNEQSLELARVSAMYHQDAIRQAQTLLETIADLPALKYQTAPEISEFFKRILASNPQYSFLSLILPDGRLYASSGSKDASINFSDRFHFQQAMSQRRFVVGHTIMGMVSNQPILPFAALVIGPDGELSGALLLGQRLDEYEKVFSALTAPSGTRFVLFDPQGTRLFRYPRRDISPAGEKVIPQAWDVISGSGENTKTFQVRDQAGLSVTYSYLKIADEKEKRSELGILVGIPTPSFSTQVWPVIAWTVFALGFIAAGAMAIGYFLSNRILTTGLVALEGKTSEIIRSGQLVRVDMVTGCNEVVALAKSFNRMVDFLKRDKEGRDRAEAALSDAVTRWRTLLATASDAVHILDQDGNLIQYSQSFLDMLGYTREEAAGLNVRDWDAQVPGHEVPQGISSLLSMPRAFETKHRRKDGRIIDAEINAKGVELSGRLYLYASARDISWRKQAENALRESEEMSRRLFENAPVGIFRTTMDGRLITANATHARIHGCASLEELRDHTREGTQGLYADTSKHGEVRQMLRDYGGVMGFESRRRRKDGSIVWVATNAYLIQDPSFPEPIIEGFVVDITERKRAEEELTRLATTDPLTGASNRRLFFERGAEEFARSLRHELPLALIMLDIDHFKVINDTLGHTCGDAVLRALATTCMDKLRTEDLFGRLGGEEFAALLAHTDPPGAKHTATRLLDALGRLGVPWEDGEVRFTVSIGVAALEPGDASIDDVLSRADKAMYQAKQAGRNRVR